MIIQPLAQFPVRETLPELCQALSSRGRAVLSAPPGSGKTTLVPLELLDQPWLQGRRILMLEPRRLAARASASRMASLLGEATGDTVGYQVRFDRRISSRTRIEVITEGILTRRLQRDPELSGVGLVIFDEFHERSLHADLALALCLDVCGALRDDLRLLVMSATLDCDAVSGLLGGAPVVVGGGRSYPVDIRYLSRDAGSDLPLAVAAAVRRALLEQSGDLLVFLPGAGEIRRVESLLKGRSEDGALVCPLYGDLDQAAQERAITPDPGGRRRVILSTSIAETSLTIEGVTAVIDSGWSRLPQFDPNSGLSRLQTVRVSRAASDQRAGRAGRIGPGVCYRLWSKGTQGRLPAQHPAEICAADLAPLALELAQWGVSGPGDLNWLDSPPAGAYAQAREVLLELAALGDDGRITAAGRDMSGLALHPRLAHMLLCAADSGQSALAADIAGLISERDILRTGPGDQVPVDLEERLPLLDRFRKGDKRGLLETGVQLPVCARIVRMGRSLAARGLAEGTPRASPLTPGGLLALAYPERIARRRATGGGRYLMSSGRGLVLPPHDPLAKSEFLVVARLDAGRREGRIFLAAGIDLTQIRATQKSRIKKRIEVLWDSDSRSVVAREKEMLGELVLDSGTLNSPPKDMLRSAMLAGIRAMGLRVLPWDAVSRQLQLRVQSLRRWQPHAGWPDLSDTMLAATLDQWLGPWLAGTTSQARLKQLDLTAILLHRLDWRQRQQLEQQAPSHITVPSGSRKLLQYQPDGPPLLKVKLQEMFGLERTPAVCGGEVQVMLHLLSPAQRPVQVTQDLKGFWDRTYKDIKKELQGRYPKHYWPDNPWEAKPTARLRPRGS